MISEATAEDFESLLLGVAPRGLQLPDTPIASVEVLQMLADLAARVREAFSPAAWLVIEHDEVVGLCSVTGLPAGGVLDLGYGIAASRQGRGIAGRAIGDIVAWARKTAYVNALTADTSPANMSSQRVLARNGFNEVGERVDDEDGRLLCWRHALA